MSEYKALTAYQDESVVEEYERRRFSGLVGRYVWRREQRAVGRNVASVGSAETVLDCPSGFGRWLPVIERLDPIVVLENDVSLEMLEHGRSSYNDRWPGVRTNAEHLPYQDASFDLVFCHAFTKHLPHETQVAVLKEFSRVSRRHVICSFTMRAGLGGAVLRLRERLRGSRSNAVTREWLERAAAEAGLRLVRDRPCTSHIGAERSVLFERVLVAA
ncbi:class I SAM-dependent methyltransferase [Aeromicrobium terrae]|uniref:Class I SAM-dependent methyltransferase n=1 Tax=Aeromicrobium terrae TaxID=2498846 RepID=A0A5C8NGI1_9ACTN|nr:class I SAM-dependent methyltransferase [Aeromicrobium terrae]TXL57658.1 class I SAM-dependent methyltransferase [Aeromicrobium terrae]